ncbi:MAG: carboxymuconolactone decarboxylase family protein [Candidatus Helarchaeota archaeon]
MEKISVENVLKMMKENLGEEPRPMVLMAKLIPEIVVKQAQDRKFTFDLPNIPPKYKHLICIAATAAVIYHLCTETYIKLAEKNGISKEEIAEPIATAKFALGSTVFAAAVEGMDFLTKTR